MSVVKRSAVPIGTVIIWPVALSGSSMEDESGTWLLCNGQSISESTYPDLIEALGGATTVPNYQGLFLRGYGSQSFTQENGTQVGTTETVHTSGELGEVQGDATREATGDLPAGAQASDSYFFGRIAGVFTYDLDANAPGIGSTTANNVAVTFSNSRRVPTAEEIRPVNTAVNYLIKAKHPE